MPQVDLETLVSVCGGGGTDRKIACETLADAEDVPPAKVDVPVDSEDVPPDFPPESFWLSKDAEFDWFDRNAFYDRRDSGKGNSNSTNLNPNLIPSTNSSSQRFPQNFKSKATSIIGLPKTQSTNYVDAKRRNCRPPNIRLFPKRSESVGKSASDAEPSSPKVSCMGRVRSKRGRRRSCEKSKKKGKKPEESINRNKQRSSFVTGFMAVFRRRREKPSRSDVDKKGATVESPPRKSTTLKTKHLPVSVETVAEPPSLGAMAKFSSGRRSWSTEDVDVSKTADSLDLDRRVVN